MVKSLTQTLSIKVQTKRTLEIINTPSWKELNQNWLKQGIQSKKLAKFEIRHQLIMTKIMFLVVQFTEMPMLFIGTFFFLIQLISLSINYNRLVIERKKNDFNPIYRKIPINDGMTLIIYAVKSRINDGMTLIIYAP
jgi:hypothetical protein